MDDNSMTQTDERAEYIAGLRALADVLEANPHAKLPQTGNGLPLTWVTSWEDDPKAATLAIVRAVGGKWNKLSGGTDGAILRFATSLHGFSVEILCSREQVCRRVVTGTETVDLPAVEAQPARTETREVIEWVCEPLLAEAAS